MLRLLRGLLRLVVVLVVLVVVVVAALWFTNPKPKRSEKWDRFADMPDKRGEVAAAIVGDKLVVAGGLHGVGSTSGAVHVFDVSSDRWREAPSLPALRHHAAAAARGKHVYVSGGAPRATDWTPQDDLWRAKPGGEWKALATMPEGRQGHAMVEVRKQLYVVGGVGGTDETLIYDIGDDEWSSGAALPEGRDHLRAVAWDGRVWALGGRSDEVQRRVDVYDPRKDRWRSGPELPEPMSAMAVGVINDELHVIGGEDPNLFGGVSDKHFVLEDGADEWREASAPVLQVHGAGFGVHGGRLVIAGGASRQGALSTISWTGVTQVFER